MDSSVGQRAGRRIRLPDNAGARGAADWRHLLGVGSALVLQACHPAIGGAVGDFTPYATDPWGRLNRSLWPVLAMVMLEDHGYGADLRRMHRGITGSDAKGRRYHAWDAEAAFLVLATAVHSASRGAKLYGTSLTDEEYDEVFGAWRRAALAFGVPAATIPKDVGEFEVWWDHIVNDVLEDHDTAHGVLESLRRPVPPPYVPGILWSPARPIAGRFLSFVTVAGLPPVMRERLGCEWTDRDEALLAALGAVVRGVDKLLPPPLRELNWTIVRFRQSRIRSYVAYGARLGIAPSVARHRGYARPTDDPHLVDF